MSRKDLARTSWQRRITVSFRARRAADAKSFYTIMTEKRYGGPGCAVITMGPIARDVSAGAVITQTRWVDHHCRGTMTIRIGYEQQHGPTQLPFDSGGRPDAKVGTTVVRLR